MIDFDTATLQDRNKFSEHYPFEGDLTLQVLKGHLLVEEILREIFEMMLPHPKALSGSKGASFDCHQIICLVESITPNSQAMPWVWVSAKKLNNIRNDLAHQLNPKGLSDKVNDLIKYVMKNTPQLKEFRRELAVPDGNDLYIVIMAICNCFSSLKGLVAHHVHRA